MSMGIKTVRWLNKIIKKGKKRSVNVRKRKFPQCHFWVAANRVTGPTFTRDRETLTKSNGK